jgi:hypothetical protein
MTSQGLTSRKAKMLAIPLVVFLLSSFAGQATADHDLCGVNGGIQEYIGDLYCDPNNNNPECDYDGGDCCGDNVDKTFCGDPGDPNHVLCSCLEPTTTNCDSAVDIPRNDVILTDIVFNATAVSSPDRKNFNIDLRYFAEQVIPEGMRSGVYFWATGRNGNKWNTTAPDRADCAFQFDFGTGITDPSPHTSGFKMPKKCFDIQVTPRRGARVIRIEHPTGNDALVICEVEGTYIF